MYMYMCTYIHIYIYICIYTLHINNKYYYHYKLVAEGKAPERAAVDPHGLIITSNNTNHDNNS